MVSIVPKTRRNSILIISTITLEQGTISSVPSTYLSIQCIPPYLLDSRAPQPSHLSRLAGLLADYSAGRLDLIQQLSQMREESENFYKRFDKGVVPVEEHSEDSESDRWFKNIELSKATWQSNWHFHFDFSMWIIAEQLKMFKPKIVDVRHSRINLKIWECKWYYLIQLFQTRNMILVDMKVC